MTDKSLDCVGNTGHIGKSEVSLSNAYLIEAVAGALLGSGKTCDEDNWHKVMAYEAIRALRLIGALK